ncbi:MAG: hypothetical protein P8R42_21960 [Candidatus Binatia bacterium]|nr:hypothetical protein [Candidatus Binatia bacterium]
MSDRARQACIVGIGETRYAKWGGITDASERGLACQAVAKAAADAGLAVADIDGVGSFADDRNLGVLIARDLGMRELRYAGMSWLPGGGGACGALGSAARAVEAGHAEAVVVYRSLCQGQHFRFGSAAASYGQLEKPGFHQASNLLEAEMAFSLPFGMFSAPIAYAMVMQRHMHLYGTTSEQMGAVAVATRAHAQRNARAVMHGRPMTLEDHQASRLVAEPFRLFDCCLENDGACAVIVSTAERARDLGQPVIRIAAHAEGAPGQYGWGPFLDTNGSDELYAGGGASVVAREMWKHADLSPSDVDVAQIYDHFTGLVLLVLEAFGFCEVGESGPFAASGALAWPNGALPNNTHGGSLSEAYMHGMNHINEGVRQLRGTSTSQVEDARTCLVTSAAGVPTSAALLVKD